MKNIKEEYKVPEGWSPSVLLSRCEDFVREESGKFEHLFEGVMPSVWSDKGTTIAAMLYTVATDPYFANDFATEI